MLHSFFSDLSCQAVTDPFGLTRGFTKADVLVEPGGYFRLETEAFIFAPSRPSRKRYFIACYVAYCYGVYDANNPANNDGRCENVSRVAGLCHLLRKDKTEWHKPATICKRYLYHNTWYLLLQIKDLGPVVQSIVSLTSSLRGKLIKCFKTL